MHTPDKWTPFWMSLIVPGAGQMWLRSGWCLPWLAANCGACIAKALISPRWGWPQLVGLLIFVPLGLASAEHAKRLSEPQSPWPTTPGVKAWTAFDPPRRSSISMRLGMSIPRPVQEIWQRVSDLPRFLTIDPLHVQVRFMRRELAPGVDLVLDHRVFGFSFLRFGRLLTWREGAGYAFSDLSARGARGSFPHVFFLEIEAERENPEQTRLTLEVRGKWTSRWIPVWLGQYWLRYVMRDHARLLREAM